MSDQHFGYPPPPSSLGNPSLIPGVRVSPGYVPSPNSEPLGAKTGAPPRTRFYSTNVLPFSAIGGAKKQEPTRIVDGASPNRVIILTPPLVGFTIYIGDAGVSPQNGLALVGGLAYEAILPGLQDLYAVTDAPVYLPLQVQIAAVLLAERERKL